MSIAKNWIYKHQHISTIVPSLFRKVDMCSYQRELINTPDGDFFHIDKLEGGHKKLVVLLHGLEGSSKEHYILGQAHSFFEQNYDVIAINFRSCSGVMNKTSRLYHSGETEDLRFLINKIYKLKKYDSISLVGFSLGGNVILKYLGEEASTVNPLVKSAVSVSVPMDLRGCSYKLASGFNKVYSLHFMSTLRKKVTYLKKTHNHDALRDIKVSKLKTFLDFDDLVTAPLHGFSSGEDYWEKASSRQFLHNIQVPTLIINAKNDPFLSDDCFPGQGDISNSYIEYRYPALGGHVGFVQSKLNEKTLIEEQSFEFVSQHNT
jgi:predicted alpha/beta-fold hydrolase